MKTCPVATLIRVHSLVSFLNSALIAGNVFHVSHDMWLFLHSVSLSITTKFLAVMCIIQADIKVCWFWTVCHGFYPRSVPPAFLPHESISNSPVEAIYHSETCNIEHSLFACRSWDYFAEILASPDLYSINLSTFTNSRALKFCSGISNSGYTKSITRVSWEKTKYNRCTVNVLMEQSFTSLHKVYLPHWESLCLNL